MNAFPADDVAEPRLSLSYNALINSSYVEMLIFLYNSDSGLLDLLKDGLHKVVSPSTYPCRLYDLTWSVAGPKRRWKNFVRGLSVPVEFLHKDDVERRYPGMLLRPPCAYRIGEQGPVEVIDRDTMQGFSSLQELEAAVRAAV